MKLKNKNNFEPGQEVRFYEYDFFNPGFKRGTVVKHFKDREVLKVHIKKTNRNKSIDLKKNKVEIINQTF